MNRPFRLWAIWVISICGSAFALHLQAGETAIPNTMVKVVVAAEATDMPEDSFGTKPRTFYRAGDTYGRTEEADDPAMKLHGLIIISEPDSWMINLTDKTGKHFKDPGPTFVMHMPVFALPNLPKIFYSLEFGREFEFFEKVSKKKKYPKTVNGMKFDSYAVGTGGYMVVVYTEPNKEVPLFAFLFKGNDVILTIRYMEYKSGLSFDPALFKVPGGIKITEQTP